VRVILTKQINEFAILPLFIMTKNIKFSKCPPAFRVSLISNAYLWGWHKVTRPEMYEDISTSSELGGIIREPELYLCRVIWLIISYLFYTKTWSSSEGLMNLYIQLPP
jgi:hypothetical protein